MMRSCALIFATCSAVAALDPRSISADLTNQLHSLLNTPSLTSGGKGRSGEPPVPTIDVPPQFTAKFQIYNNESARVNQTLSVHVEQILTGTLWGATATKQFRYSGSSTIMIDGKPVSKSSVTLVLDGSRGLKYTYVPDKKATDDGANTVACISEPLGPADDPTNGGKQTTFAGEVFLDDRVAEAFFDPVVAKPAGNLMFVDPFRQEPVGTMTFDGVPGGNTSIAIYEDLSPVMIKPTEFEMPKGIQCKPGAVEVPLALSRMFPGM